MLEYVKLVLQKVSFDKKLFEKELKKSIQYLNQNHEIEELRDWCYKQFNNQEYAPILDNCFWVLYY
jgi:hypothetical protein